MRDVSPKPRTLRRATARAVLKAAKSTLERVRAGDAPKGDPLPVARVAAIQAVKNTSQIVPFCHPLPIEDASVAFDVGEDRIAVRVTVQAIARTGVEMEALTGAAVAALTLYDMLKMLDDTLRIEAVDLAEKRGGKSDFAGRDRERAAGLRAAVLISSDSVAAGAKADTSGRTIADRLAAEGLAVAPPIVVADERERIVAELIRLADEEKVDLIVTTGGTGFGPRDLMPEAMAAVIEREAPGIAEAARAYGQDRTPYAMLSRGRAGVRGTTLIVNLPGSRRGVIDALNALFPGLIHAFKMLAGGGHDDTGREVQRGSGR